MNLISTPWPLPGVLFGALVYFGLVAQGQSVSSPLAPAAASEWAPLPFLMPDDFEELNMVAWRVEQGYPDPHNPLVEPKMPWDLGGVFGHGTVLHDPIDGRWKAWQISRPPQKPRPDGRPGWTNERRLTYLESDDGVHWRRPELPLVKWPGYERTNILMNTWCSYASVNIDPRREWPYEIFMFRDPGYPGAEPTVGALPLPLGKNRHPNGLYRFRSKNGTLWEATAGPLELNTSDSCYIFRQEDGYVAYHKTELPAFPGGLAPYDIGDGGVRVIGRRSSPDGIHWSNPTELVLTPDWRDPGDTQFMELNPLRYPGGYIAIVAVYHNHTQTTDLQWAASRDGVHWWRPDRRPALPNLPLGEYGGGNIWPMRSPVLDGRELHVFYAGTQGLHGDLFDTHTGGPRRLKASGESLSRQSSNLPSLAAFCRATWQAHRLWALAPAAGGPYIGQAVTKSRPFSKTELLVNVVTRAGGELRAELLDAEGRTLPGFTADDSQPIRGDHAVATLRWSYGSVAPTTATKVRFLLREAYLYGFSARAVEPPK